MPANVGDITSINSGRMVRISFLWVMIWLLSSSGFAQTANLEDGFEDGNFTSDPVWSGDTANFIVFDLDGNNVVRLNDSGGAANTSYLSTPSASVTGFWEFWVQIDGATPSGSNNIQIFLMSDTADLSSAVNGYAVRAGETGDDVFRIVRYDSGSEAAIVLSDTTVLRSGNSYRVRVDRDGSGSWSVQVGEGYAGELQNSGNTATDNTYTAASHFGFLVNYTSSRTDDFYFDFKIDPPPVIVEPLRIGSLTLRSDTELDLGFSRDIDPASVSASDVLLNGNLNPQSSAAVAPDTLRLTFASAFAGGQNQLEVSGIGSANGDTVLTDTTLTFFMFDEFEPGDVIINEFLKDPPPGSGLPEYIELRNTSAKYLNLKGWEIGDNNSLATISDIDQVILPDSFLVVSGDADALRGNFGEGIFVDVSLPALNNTTDQIRLFDSDGSLADSLEYTPDWGGVDVALERRTADAPSTLQPNWGDSPFEVGTPGKTNDIEPDTTAPDLESVTFLNDSTIQVVFSEQVLAGPAEDPDNFVVAFLLKVNPLSGENEFVKTTFFAPDTVLLEFKISLYTGVFGAVLLVSNQEDVFGNVAELLEWEFDLVQTEEAAPGDVVINEFMYDPAPGYTEFVEIYNHTNKSFNLKGWTLSDNTGNEQVITDEDFYMRSFQDLGASVSEYVILVPDSTIPGGDSNRIVMNSRFPALNNTTDAIVLKNAEGVVIDSLTYSNTWGGEEVSLERRSVDVPGIYRENWGDSPSENFGTPGLENEVEADTTPPAVISATALNEDTIVLGFTERLDAEKAGELSSYSTSSSIGFSRVFVDAETVTLNLNTALTNGQEVEITVSDQADIFGNELNSATVSVTYYELVQADRGDVVINEILYRRADAVSAEFVELLNTSDRNFDLSAWSFKDAGSSSVSLPDELLLPAGTMLVLTDREDFASSVSNAVYLSGFPSLNDDGDQIVIRNSEGVTIDSLFYRDSWGGDEAGVSLERIDPLSASNDASNWASSIASSGFTAGQPSSVFEVDITPPEVIFASQQDTAVQVVFSEFVRFTDQTAFRINSTEYEVLYYERTRANIVLLQDASGASVKNRSGSTNGSTLSIIGLQDVRGNLAGEIEHPVSVPVQPGSVIINEIMFDPLADNDDNLPDQTEYIELFNPTGSAVSIEGIILHDAPDEDGEVRPILPVSSQYKWIPAGGFMLIYSEDQTDRFEESRVYEYFSLDGETEQFTMRVDRSSLSLASSGDAVYLADNTGATIDSVFYDESWHNPNLFDTDGVALEKIDPGGPSDDASNWSSGTNVSGGSPLAENSIFQEAGASPDEAGITFTPNPFSPDEDGFDDNLFINYRLDAADYLLRIRIFDRYGRQVRELADGLQAGFEGSVIWDGLTDDRRKNRVGIYVVLFEAYNSATGKDRTFKETVVLARKF